MIHIIDFSGTEITLLQLWDKKEVINGYHFFDLIRAGEQKTSYSEDLLPIGMPTPALRLHQLWTEETIG